MLLFSLLFSLSKWDSKNYEKKTSQAYVRKGMLNVYGDEKKRQKCEFYMKWQITLIYCAIKRKICINCLTTLGTLVWQDIHLLWKFSIWRKRQSLLWMKLLKKNVFCCFFFIDKAYDWYFINLLLMARVATRNFSLHWPGTKLLVF